MTVAPTIENTTEEAKKIVSLLVEKISHGGLDTS